MTSSASGQRSVSDCWADYRSDAEVSINYSVFVPVASRLSHFLVFLQAQNEAAVLFCCQLDQVSYFFISNVFQQL